MMSGWRVSSFTGALIACYFIPCWTIDAFRLMTMPIHGLYERHNVALGLFISDHLHLTASGAVRSAWLLALARLTLIAFFCVFLAFLTRPKIRRSGGADEALAIALTIGSLISFGGVLLAHNAGEAVALRHHASELLMLLGTAIVLLVEMPAPKAGQLVKTGAPAAATPAQVPSHSG